MVLVVVVLVAVAVANAAAAAVPALVLVIERGLICASIRFAHPCKTNANSMSQERFLLNWIVGRAYAAEHQLG